MYDLNGIELHDPDNGLTVLNASELTAGASIARPSLTSPGLDGSVPMPGVVETPTMGIVLGLKRSILDDVRALLHQPILFLGRKGTPGKAVVELNALSEQTVTGGDDPEMELKAVLSFPGVWFRGDTETYAMPVGGAYTDLHVFPDMSGKINDVIVRLTDITRPQVTDSAGTFFKYDGTVAPGQYLRFHADTGRAWLTDSDAWTGGTEVDPLLLTYGRGPAFLVITPYLETLTTRYGKLRVDFDATGSAAIDIRGRSAYLV